MSPASYSLHDSVDHRPAEPRALARRLGGAERLEHPVDYRRFHSAAVIHDREAEIAAGLELGSTNPAPLVDRDLIDRQVDGSTAGLESVSGVGAEVHHSLVNVARVRHHRGRSG